MIKQLLTTVLLLATYWVNYLSSSGQLGENLMRLREIFPFPYMPAGWTFAVARSAIYLALGVWCLRSWTKTGKHDETNKKILPRFWVSSVLNIIRIFFTAREWYALSVIIIATLMIVLWKIIQLLNHHKAELIQTIPF
jgi:tryptophan-rich sensory protein